jgi:hypothetical protein
VSRNPRRRYAVQICQVPERYLSDPKRFGHVGTWPSYEAAEQAAEEAHVTGKVVEVYAPDVAAGAR